MAKKLLEVPFVSLPKKQSLRLHKSFGNWSFSRFPVLHLLFDLISVIRETLTGAAILHVVGKGDTSCAQLSSLQKNWAEAASGRGGNPCEGHLQ